VHDKYVFEMCTIINKHLGGQRGVLLVLANSTMQSTTWP